MVLSEQFEAESDAEVCGAPVGAAASEMQLELLFLILCDAKV